MTTPSQFNIPSNETVETMETVKTVETVETVETMETVKTVETVETVEKVETVKTVETVETVEKQSEANVIAIVKYTLYISKKKKKKKKKKNKKSADYCLICDKLKMQQTHGTTFCVDCRNFLITHDVYTKVSNIEVASIEDIATKVCQLVFKKNEKSDNKSIIRFFKRKPKQQQQLVNLLANLLKRGKWKEDTTRCLEGIEVIEKIRIDGHDEKKDESNSEISIPIKRLSVLNYPILPPHPKNAFFSDDNYDTDLW